MKKKTIKGQEQEATLDCHYRVFVYYICLLHCRMVTVKKQEEEIRRVFNYLQITRGYWIFKDLWPHFSLFVFSKTCDGHFYCISKSPHYCFLLFSLSFP